MQRHLTSKLRFSTISAAAKEAVIVSYARTPISTFGGSFASMSGPDLGAVAVEAAIQRAGLELHDIQEAYLGNVVSAGIGQAPTRQAILKAGTHKFVDVVSYLGLGRRN